jgi:hypothetical protein
MTDETAASAPATSPRRADEEQTLFHTTYTIPEGYAAAAARAFMRFQLTRPAVGIQTVLMLITFLILVLALWRGPYGFWAALAVDVLVLGATILSFTMTRNRLARRLESNAVPGSVYELTLTDSTITIRTPNATSTSNYRTYESATPFVDFVLLRLRGSRIRSILPRQLFTDQSLAFVQSKVQR